MRRDATNKSSTRHRSAVAFAIIASFVLAPAGQAALTEGQPTTTTTKQTDKAPEIPTVESLLGNSESGEAVLEQGTASGPGTADPMASEDQTATAPSTEPAQTAAAIVPPAPLAPIAAPAPKQTLPPLAQMKLHYKNGKWRDALAVIATMKPTELTHYYAGLCYQSQGQLTQAAQEFNYTASIAKDATIRYMAQSALRSVSNYARARTYGGQGNQFASFRGGGGGGSRTTSRGGGGGGGGTS